MKLYILKVAKKYVMVLNSYWLGWKYIVYKLLAYTCLYNSHQLGRYCDSHLKEFVHLVVTLAHKFKAVIYHACNLDLSIHVHTHVH